MSAARRMRRVLLATVLLVLGSSILASSAMASSSKQAALGAPIKVMTINHAQATSNTFPEFGWVATAYVKSVNAAGGIVDGNGVRHMLKLELCEDKNDPNQLANCGRQAVADKVVAIVSAESVNDNSIIPLLAKNKIAWFADCCAFLPITSNSTDSFPTGSSFMLNVGIGAVSGNQCRKTAFVTTEGAFADANKEFFLKGQESQGKTNSSTTELPAVATDYSPQVAQILAGQPDCIAAIGLQQQNWFAFLPALLQAGGNQRIIAANASLAGVPEKFPAQFKNSLTIGLYPDYNGPAFAKYRAALAKYESGNKGDWGGIGAEATWTGYVQFTNMIKMMKGPITGPTFLKAAQGTKKLLSDGLAPPLNFTKPFVDKTQPRLFNASVTLFTVVNGVLKQYDNKFYDLTQAYLGKPEKIDIKAK